MSSSQRRESALAELAALAENVERCRERLVALAESQRLATHDPKKPENDDGLLMAIYEAERGLINAVRLLQRAARSRSICTPRATFRTSSKALLRASVRVAPMLPGPFSGRRAS